MYLKKKLEDIEHILKEETELLRKLLEVQSSKAKPEKPEDDLIDAHDVKRLLRISDSTLYRLKKSKALKPIRIGKRDYYRKAVIGKQGCEVERE